MGDEDASPDWTRERVADLLKQQAAPGKAASAQVFLEESVPAEGLLDTARKAADEAAARLGRAPAVEIGKVHRLAKSVSVKGDPEVIAGMSESRDVKTILPSELPDVYPKPVKRRPVD